VITFRDPQASKIKKIHDYYVIGKELGQGGFAVVNECTSKTTKDVYAVKCITKEGLPNDDLVMIQREVSIMEKLRHPGIVQLVDLFDEDDTLYLVMELIRGGELFDRIIEKGSFSENESALIIHQILEAVAYMHQHGVVHRDLKPENLLCATKDSRVIKIADFGLSKEGSNLVTSCGSPGYIAPEVLLGEEVYDNTVDIWSIAIITYVLLCGYPPFASDNLKELCQQIMKAEVHFPNPEWTYISSQAKDFIKKILVKNPANRPSAIVCLSHPWITSHVSH